jgi:hypothetical protein
MKRARIAGYVFGACVIVLGAFYVAFLDCVDLAHVGLAWNLATGRSTLQRPGWHLTPPWVLVARVDARPVRVCITSASRGYSCRLVQFEPSAYQQFLAVQGFGYYWWANRISFNFGYSEEYRGFRDLLRGYAYGVEQYPFVRTLREYKEGE